MFIFLIVGRQSDLLVVDLDKAFYAVVKTQKRRSNKIYNSELTMTKI